MYGILCLYRSFTSVVKELCVLQINELLSGFPFCFNLKTFAFGRYDYPLLIKLYVFTMAC